MRQLGSELPPKEQKCRVYSHHMALLWNKKHAMMTGLATFIPLAFLRVSSQLIYVQFTYILITLILYETHMRRAKQILFTLVVIIVLTTVAIWSLTKIVTPDALKTIINKQLSLLTTQKYHGVGAISWQLFPHPGIKITHIHVGEENDISDSICIDHLILNLQITALLRGRLVFNELKIDGLKIHMNPEGEMNSKQSKAFWGLLISTHHVPDIISAQFAINSVLLTHGQVVILQPQAKITLSGLQIRAKRLNLNKDFFPLQLKGTLAASIADNQFKATLNYKGRVQLTPSIRATPLNALPQATMDGQLLVQNLRYNRFKIAKINTNVKIRQGKVTMNPFNMSLYSGESVGDVTYQVVSKKIAINQTATNLDAQQLFNDLFSNHLVKGNVDFSIHATTNLLHDNVRNNLLGSGSLTIKDGSLSFIDLNQLMNESINKIHSLVDQEQDISKLALSHPLFNSMTYPGGGTQFQLLSIQYHVLDAKLTNDSLLLQTNNLQLKGSGQVNLQDATENFNLSAKLSSNDSAVVKMQQLLGGSFPLKVYGPLAKPHISADKKALNPIIFNYLLKNTLAKPVVQIKNNLKGLLSYTVSLFQEKLR